MSVIDKKLIDLTLTHLKKRPWEESHELIEQLTSTEFQKESKLSQDDIMKILDTVTSDTSVQIFIRYQRIFQEKSIAEQSLSKKTKPIPEPDTEEIDNIN
jgi:hypothetical protein